VDVRGRAGAGDRLGVPPDASADADARDPVEVARAICLRLLTAAPRTRAQLADALRRRGVPASAVDDVLGRLTDVGLIDDRAFAEAWVSSRHLGRGLGRRALSAELRARGVDGDTVTAAVAALDPADEEAAARSLVGRRLAATRGQRPEARIRRLVGMLARRGYPSAMAVRVVREALAAEAAEADERHERPEYDECDACDEIGAGGRPWGAADVVAIGVGDGGCDGQGDREGYRWSRRPHRADAGGSGSGETLTAADVLDLLDAED
jgi:regulatory protein